jgi:DNA-binding transcriptional LysR family regulator
MVQGGLGIALLPSEEFKSRALDGIVELNLKETIRKEVGIAWRKDTTSPLVEATVRFAKEWVDYA